MPDTKPTAPLDLSIFDNLETAPAPSLPVPAAAAAAAAPLPVPADDRLAPQPAQERLVDIANLKPEDLAAAQASAAKVDFRNANTLLTHGEGVLANIARPPGNC
jgi:hypothetical protein